jgi:hypothetical protein
MAADRGDEMTWDRGPTSEITRCLLPLIASGRSGLDIVALAADVIAASARLNIWAQEVQNGKYGHSIDHLEKWCEIADSFVRAEDLCIAAVHKFNDGGDRKELAEALRKLTAIFNQRPDPALPASEISN